MAAIPFYTGGDAGYTGDTGNMQNALFMTGQNYGQQFNSQFGDQYAQQGANAADYKSKADQIWQFMQENPGYTQEEASQILDQQGLNSGLTSDEQYGNNFLSADEIAQQQGNPWSRTGLFDPQYAEDIQADQTARVREQLGAQSSNLRNAYDVGSGAVDNSVDSMASGMRGALGTGAEAQRGAYDAGAQDLRGTVDPSKLTLSDADVQGMKDQAARTVGAQYGTDRDEIMRRIEASGAVNPYAQSTALQRLEQDRATSSADAITDAQLKGKQAQIAANANVAGMQGTNERTLLASKLGLESGLTSQGLQSEETIGGTGTAAQQALLNQKLGLEQNIGTAGTGAEMQLGNNTQNVHQANVNQSVDIAKDIDTTQAARAAQIANNRQTTAQANQATKYAQQTGTSNARSARAGTVANARVAGQNLAASYWPAQQAQAQQAQGQAGSQQVTGAATGMQGMAQGAQGQLALSAKPSIWDKLISAGASAAGAYFGGG